MTLQIRYEVIVIANMSCSICCCDDYKFNVTFMCMLSCVCLSGFIQALESFGRSWKLTILFSRTCKVLENGGFFILAMQKFWIFVWDIVECPKMDIT